MVGYPVNCLCVDDQLLLDNKIGNYSPTSSPLYTT